MTGLPTVRAWLDDGSGTFPFDVSNYLLLTAGVECTVGRGDEFDDIDATEIKVRLDNLDGRFTLGSAQYGCFVDQPLRVTVTSGSTTRTYRGLVQSWPVQWTHGQGNYAYASISAIDVKSRLERQTLESNIANEARANGVDVYYPLTEEEGAVSAGALIGDVPTMEVVGRGVAPTFGAAEGMLYPDDAVVTFTGGGKYLRGRIERGPRDSWSVSAFIQMTGAPATDMTVMALNLDGRIEDSSPIAGDHPSMGLYVTIDNIGRLNVGLSNGVDRYGTNVITNDYVNDGRWHHIGIFKDSAGYFGRVLDGVADPFPTFGNGDIPSDFAPRYVTVGSSPTFSTAPNPAVSVGHLIVAPSTLDPADIYAAGLTGFAGETSGQRVARIAGYAGLTAVSTASTVLDAQDMTGVSVWDALEAVRTTEGGRQWVNGSSQIVLKSRQEGWATARSTPSLDVAAGQVEDDLVITADKQFLNNRAKGTRRGGADQQAQNATSIATYGVYERDLGQLLVQTDGEVSDRCSWIANTYSTIRPRMSQVTVDCLTRSSSIAQAALSLQIGSRLRATGLPTQSPVADADQIVEGWSETISLTDGDATWRMTFNTTPTALQQVFVLDSTSFGVVESATPLAY